MGRNCLPRAICLRAPWGRVSGMARPMPCRTPEWLVESVPMRIRRGATLYGACSEGMLRRMIRNLAQRSLSFSEDEASSVRIMPRSICLRCRTLPLLMAIWRSLIAVRCRRWPSCHSLRLNSSRWVIMPWQSQSSSSTSSAVSSASWSVMRYPLRRQESQSSNTWGGILSSSGVSGALSGTSGEGSSGLRSGLSHVSMITSVVSMSMRRISCAIWLWRSLVAVRASSCNALTRWTRCLRSVLCAYSARWRNEVCPVPT